jgi:hypothetical protein
MDVHSLDWRHWWTWGDVQGQKDHVMALVAKAAQRQLRLASYSSPYNAKFKDETKECES